MPLLRVSDLDQPQEYKAQYIQQAMQLSILWHQWKKQHNAAFKFEVEHHSSDKRAAGLHSSEVSGCQRRLVYALRNEPKTLPGDGRDVNMQRRFDLGTLVHALVQWEFEQMCTWLGGGITFKAEAPIYPGLGGVAKQYDMHSSCDGIFTFWYQGEPYMRVGLEIKTMSDKEYDKVTEPKDDHKDQTCMYMKALDLPLMWVLYYNKSNSLTVASEPPWLFQFNTVLWNKLERRITESYQYAADGNIPARQEGRPCGWCPYTHICQPNYLKNSSQGGVVPYSAPTRDFR